MAKLGDLTGLKQLFESMKNPEKVIVFIDAEYVIQSLRRIKGKSRQKIIGIHHIQWQKIVDFATENRTLKAIYYYSSALDEQENPETYQKQKEYLAKLQRKTSGLTIRLGRMQKIKIKSEKTWTESAKAKHEFIHTWVQKGIDVRIAVDMLTKAFKNEYDTAILIAGDSDFEEVIKETRQVLDKKVEIITFDRADSKILDSFALSADKHTIITYELGKDNFWTE